MSNFLTSTEFYVIAFTLAALLVGLIVRPRERGQAETTFASGSLSDDPDTTPHLRFRCLDNGDVIIDRYGLSGLTTASTVALAINRIGFDLTIEERVTLGPSIPAGSSSTAMPANRATFLIEGLARERYHIAYNSSAYSTFLSTTLPNRPGIDFTRDFPA